MKVSRKIAFACFTLAALAALATGIRYLLADRIMPYHLAAMGSTWEALQPGVRLMSLSFMHAAGLGLLVTGLASALLLGIPFRRGEVWPGWVMGLLIVLESGGILVIATGLRLNTPAEPPLLFTGLVCFLGLAGILLNAWGARGLKLCRGMKNEMGCSSTSGN